MHIYFENYLFTSGVTTNGAFSGCFQNYQYLQIHVGKLQCNIQILAEN